MKHLFFTFFFLSIIITGCSDSNDMELGELTGTYVGTVEGVNFAKYSNSKYSDMYTAEVKIRGNQLEVNCIGPHVNAQIMLEYYEHEGGYMVCLAGEDYKNFYGHDHGKMNGNHMNGRHTNGTPWMNHLNRYHQSNENHSNGGFDLNNQSFTCTFSFNNQSVTFSGKKQ